MVSFKKVQKTFTEEKYLPGVIEPSFGIGRIIWAILEHRFQKRESDAKRTYFNFPPKIAPVKCSILPVISTEEFWPKVKEVEKNLKRQGISTKIDVTNITIGKLISSNSWPRFDLLNQEGDMQERMSLEFHLVSQWIRRH